MPAQPDADQRESVATTSWRSLTGELLAMAGAMAPGQLSDITPGVAHEVAADWPGDTRSLLLWLTRIRPQSRARYLAALSDFLGWAGIDGPDDALRASLSDAVTMQQVVRKYVLQVDERRSERLFTYSAIRSFFARGHAPLPGDISFDVGGSTSSWWVQSGRPTGMPSAAPERSPSDVAE